MQISLNTLRLFFVAGLLCAIIGWVGAAPAKQQTDQDGFPAAQIYAYQLSDNYPTWPQYTQTTFDELDRFGEPDDRLSKRSVAVGRPDFRPSKRSVALGRANFRPAKRSVATGRSGFRPAKRFSGLEMTYPWI